MNLLRTIQALEAIRTEQYPDGLAVALNIGEHRHCDIESNCPLAIQLRRFIGETGVTLEQLLEGYQEVIASEPVKYDLAQFDTSAKISIAGKEYAFDFNDFIETQMRRVIEGKLVELNEQQAYIKALGTHLYRCYLHEINKLRSDHALLQLEFPMVDLIAYKVFISSESKNYTFTFPVTYHPEYIVRDGVRFELSNEDKASVERTDIYLKFTITSEDNFLSAVLLYGNGSKFYHYHGRTYDCWGSVVLPKRWDRTLSSLHRLKERLMNSLITINYDSLVIRQPSGMPSVESLLGGSTKLGREGELEQPIQAVEQPQGWGRTGRRR